MGWNYRKRIKIAPGVTMNLGKNGASTTVGKKGMSVNMGPKGTYLNTGIPGSGLYSRQKISGSSGQSKSSYKSSGGGWGAEDTSCLTSCSSCFASLISLFLFLAGILLFILNLADVFTPEETVSISYTMLSLSVLMVLPFIRMFRRSGYAEEKPALFRYFRKVVFACGFLSLGIGLDGPRNLVLKKLRPDIGIFPAKLFLVIGIIMLVMWIYLLSYDRLNPFFKQLFYRFKYKISNFGSESIDDDEEAEVEIQQTVKTNSPSEPRPVIKPSPVLPREQVPDDEDSKWSSGGIYDRDPLFEEAARFIVTCDTVSTSSLQRRYSIGYNRAGKIMDQMEAAGIVGPTQGGKPRQVLMDSLQLERLLELDDAPQSKENPPSTSGNPVPETLFRDIVNNVGMLYIYLQTTSKNSKALNSLNLDAVDHWKEMPFNVDPRLAIVVIRDLEICYKNLGYDILANKGENVAITLFTVKLVSKEESSPSQEELTGDYHRITKDFLSSFTGISKTSLPDDKLYLSEAFKQGGVDRQLILRYLTLMYDLSSTLAKVDGKISLEESTFLGKLLQEIAVVSSEEKKSPAATAAKRVRKMGAESELDSLIGMDSVKEEVQKVANFVKVQQMRMEKGMSTSPISYHCVFTGNPGTGKTTVARILAGIYRELGVLEKGHLVETDRSGLVAEYVGQTAVKTNKIIDSAIGGVLFIDEAYSLVTGSSNDYGMEAIATLLKRMEDDRDKLVVILAGYGNEMKKFIDSNPGLQSRFNRYIHFPDYSAQELMQIFDMNIKKLDYSLEENARTLLEKLFEEAVEHKDKNFGNGRYVRNIEEKILENQATRLSSKEEITEEDLRMLTQEDIPPYEQKS